MLHSYLIVDNELYISRKGISRKGISRKGKYVALRTLNNDNWKDPSYG